MVVVNISDTKDIDTIAIPVQDDHIKTDVCPQVQLKHVNKNVTGDNKKLTHLHF